MQMPEHAINWFEILVSDFDRAKKFYETMFEYEMLENQMGPARMGFLLYDFKSGGRGAIANENSCIVQNTYEKGFLFYFDIQS